MTEIQGRPRLLRGMILNRLKSRVKASHPEYTDAQIEQAFETFEVESDRPFIDWLANGGFEKILAAVLQILGLLT